MEHSLLFLTAVKSPSKRVRASAALMGLGQLMARQWVKGLAYLGALAAFIAYMAATGVRDIAGFFTLGTVEADPWLGTAGDDSIIMLLRGLLTFVLILGLVLLYRSNLRDILETERTGAYGERAPGFVLSMRSFLNNKFYVVALAIPVAGVLVFNVIPIVFMILISFTNYGGDIVPPKLVDWTGFESFRRVLSLSGIKETFFRILGWNLIWAVLSTAVNYFGGLALALLLNKKCVKFKRFWRMFPILAYAVPGFITLLAFKFLFSYGGPINHYITAAGHNAVGFLDIDAGMKARHPVQPESQPLRGRQHRWRGPLAAVPADHPPLRGVLHHTGAHHQLHRELQQLRHFLLPAGWALHGRLLPGVGHRPSDQLALQPVHR